MKTAPELTSSALAWGGRSGLAYLAIEGHVAAATQSQALSAILFLYQQVLKQEIGWLHDVVRAKQPQRLPVI